MATTPPTATPAAKPPILPAPARPRSGGCGRRHRVSPTTGYCPRCTGEVRRQAARHVTAHPGRRSCWPARWST